MKMRVRRKQFWWSLWWTQITRIKHQIKDWK
jgi:hypothetical protein